MRNRDYRNSNGICMILLFYSTHSWFFSFHRDFPNFLQNSFYVLKLSDTSPFTDVHTATNDIRLEDFFLNSSGDEPLILSLKSNARLTTGGFTGRETFIKTATVIATVYVGEDSVRLAEIVFQFPRAHSQWIVGMHAFMIITVLPRNQNFPIISFSINVLKNSDEGGTECTTDNCDSDAIPAYLLANKSYWIITRVLGCLTVDDIPMMQDRLAEMYRTAFIR